MNDTIDVEDRILALHSIKLVNEIADFFENSPEEVLGYRDFKNIQKRVLKETKTKFKNWRITR